MDLFVPGRICLFGEHSDWAGGYRREDPQIEKGYTLICGTDQGIYATVDRHPDSLVMTSTTPEGEHRGPKVISMDLDGLLEEAQRGGYWSYVAGTAYQIASRYQVGGLVIHNQKTDLPIKKGLSSSAAICVLVARAFNRLYDLGLSIRDEMEFAYLGEITTPSKCGRMDQGCAFGPVPVLMTFDADNLETQERSAGAEIYLVIVDLGGSKDTMKILEDLNTCYPQAENGVSHGVQHLLGENNKRIVHQAVEALERGDAIQLGSLMRQAQRDFDNYAIPACPEELAAPLLHHVLAYDALQPLIWGGKGVGSQGDGSAQLVARGPQEQRAVMDIIERELGMKAFPVIIGNHKA